MSYEQVCVCIHHKLCFDLIFLEFGCVCICDVVIPGTEHFVGEVHISFLAKLKIALIVSLSKTGCVCGV